MTTIRKAFRWFDEFSLGFARTLPWMVFWCSALYCLTYRCMGVTPRFLYSFPFIISVSAAASVAVFYSPIIAWRWASGLVKDRSAAKRLKEIENRVWMSMVSGEINKDPRAALTSIVGGIIKDSSAAELLRGLQVNGR